MNLEELAQRCRKTTDRLLSSTKDGAEALADTADAFHCARQAHPSNQAFAVWLAAHDLDDWNRTDRAALIKIGKPDLLRVTRIVAEEIQSTSPRAVYEEMVRRLHLEVKTDPPESVMPEVAESPSVTEKTGDPVVDERDKSDGELPPTPEPEAPSNNSPLKRLPHVEMVLPYVLNTKTRVLLGQCQKQHPRQGRALWDLLVESIQTHAYGEPSQASVTKPNLRVVLPWAPIGYAQKFDLMESESRAMIRQDIFPVVLAGGEALRRDPSRLHEAVTAHVRARAVDAQQRRLATEQATAISTLPTNEQLIQVYGTALWPWTLTSTATWTYQEALTATWFFRAIHGYLLGTAHEQAVVINLMLRWLIPAHRTGWANALRAVAQAYELNPEGEILCAPSPINFGE